MFVGTLPPVSNRASWIQSLEVVDDETGEMIDLTGISVVFEVFDPIECCTVLSATTVNGKIATQTGLITTSFTRDDMTKLCARTYEVGVTLADADDTTQFIIGTLPVLDGVVAK